MSETANRGAAAGTPGGAVRLLAGPLVVVLAAVLGYAVLALPATRSGLATRVAENLDVSGVGNPVTAVLLNFRGYDTLLEMAVLLVALFGARSLGGADAVRQKPPGPVLDLLARALSPLLIMVAGYLLWAGADAPGGAFQAGAVLAAAGVLLRLAGRRLPAEFTGLALRSVLVAGLFVFIAIGVVLLFARGGFLAYPPGAAGALILLIETAAMFSIGATLTALFAGGGRSSGVDE